MFYTVQVTTPPAVEPVSLAEMRAHLRLDQGVEDDVIEGFVTAARVLVEEWTNRALITQSLTWTMSLEVPGDQPIPLSATPAPGGWLFQIPRSPVQTITSVGAIDREGTNTPVADYGSELDVIPARLRLGQIAAQTQLEYTAGYGDDPADVPAPLRLAIKILAAHFYENRGDVPADPPQIIDLLIQPYRTPVW